MLEEAEWEKGRRKFNFDEFLIKAFAKVDKMMTFGQWGYVDSIDLAVCTAHNHCDDCALVASGVVRDEIDGASARSAVDVLF